MNTSSQLIFTEMVKASFVAAVALIATTQAQEVCCPSSSSSGCAAAPAVQNCVCGFDPYCCDTMWDAQCANEVNSGCANEVVNSGCGSAEECVYMARVSGLRAHVWEQAAGGDWKDGDATSGWSSKATKTLTAANYDVVDNGSILPDDWKLDFSGDGTILTPYHAPTTPSGTIPPDVVLVPFIYACQEGSGAGRRNWWDDATNWLNKVGNDISSWF